MSEIVGKQGFFAAAHQPRLVSDLEERPAAEHHGIVDEVEQRRSVQAVRRQRARPEPGRVWMLAPFGLSALHRKPWLA